MDTGNVVYNVRAARAAGVLLAALRLVAVGAHDIAPPQLAADAFGARVHLYPAAANALVPSLTTKLIRRAPL